MNEKVTINAIPIARPNTTTPRELLAFDNDYGESMLAIEVLSFSLCIVDAKRRQKPAAGYILTINQDWLLYTKNAFVGSDDLGSNSIFRVGFGAMTAKYSFSAGSFPS